MRLRALPISILLLACSADRPRAVAPKEPAATPSASIAASASASASASPSPSASVAAVPVAATLVHATCDAAPLQTDSPRAFVANAMMVGDTVVRRDDGGMGFYRVHGTAVEPRTAADAALELRLTAPSSLATGAPIALVLTMVNTSKAPVTVLRPLDGTLGHFRDPSYELYLRDEADGALYAYDFHGGRCGNVNPIGKDDYVTLAPRAERSDVPANGWADYLTHAVIGRAGTYSAWVVYRACGVKGGVPLGSDVIRSDLHHGVHASNAVRIVVK